LAEICKPEPPIDVGDRLYNISYRNGGHSTIILGAEILRHLVASIIVLGGLVGCVSKIDPATITSQDYSVCVSGFITKSTIDEKAIAHCARHGKKIQYLGAEQSFICGLHKGGIDVKPVFYSYKCVTEQ